MLILIYELSTIYEGMHSVESNGAYSGNLVYVRDLRNSRHYHLGIRMLMQAPEQYGKYPSNSNNRFSRLCSCFFKRDPPSCLCSPMSALCSPIPALCSPTSAPCIPISALCSPISSLCSSIPAHLFESIRLS
jgi:hypothetical protein